jgi:hypothetical protein
MTGPVLVHYLLLIVALVCFFLAFLRKWEAPAPPSVSVGVGWLGMCFWMLDILIFSGVAPK